MRDLAECQLLPPSNVVCEGYVFTSVCDSVNGGGMRAGHALTGGMAGGHACVAGGMHGEGGHAWYARPPGRLLRDMVGQCAGGTHPTEKHSCFKLHFPKIHKVTLRCSSHSRWSSLLFSRHPSTNTQNGPHKSALILNRPLGRLGISALFELCGGVRDIRSLRFTSGATPLPVYIASIAAGRFPHSSRSLSAEVGCWI